MIVLAGLGKGIKTQKSTSINGTIQSVETEGFHLPKWMSNISSENLEQEERKQKSEQNLEQYRQQMHNALHQKRK